MPNNFFRISSVLIALSLFGCSPNQEEVTITTDPLDNYRDWSIYRGDKKGNQYSELDQINKSNVNDLSIIWQYHHGNPGGPSMYSNPIMVNGSLYFTLPTLGVVSLDATSGEELWRFEIENHDPGWEKTTGRNRGVTFWDDGDRGRIFAFAKNRIYALDAQTGHPVPSFSSQGYIDVNYNLPIDPQLAAVEMTTQGIIYRDHLIIAGRVSEGYNSTPGDVRSYNARTGEFQWIFHTVPQPGEEGFDTWAFEEGETYGGANPWGGFTIDEERGWVFFATGSPAPDFIYGGIRKGANLFGNCIIAL